MSGDAGEMTPDDRLGEEPTRPLPVETDRTPTGPTEPVVAPHVPIADVATAPLDPVAAPIAGARRERPRALTGGLVSAVAVLGIVVIVVLTMYFQGRDPVPVSTPFPSQSPSITVSPPPTEAPAPAEPPSDTPSEPTPEPTPTPLPTDPPAPDPTVTPPA